MSSNCISIESPVSGELPTPMSINLQDISTVSHGLNRPECVLTHEAGYLFASDWDGNGGVSITDPGGRTRKLLSNWHHPIRPNGIALEKEGNFLLAHLGDESGGVFRLTPRGQIHPVLDSLGGQPLPPTNFVTIDHRDRLWITVSTRHVPRAAAYRSDVNDGFILVVEGDKARIATDKAPDGFRDILRLAVMLRMESRDNPLGLKQLADRIWNSSINDHSALIFELLANARNTGARNSLIQTGIITLLTVLTS